MSVEITGPKGYEYQYAITAFVAVQLLAKCVSTASPLPEVLVESGEDASIQLGADGHTRTLELQVKNKSGAIGSSTLAEWLLHFAPRSSEDCLITRLVRDSQRCAVFVTSARCEDDIQPLSTRLSTDLHTEPVAPRMSNALVTGLSRISPKGTSKLAEERRQACTHIAAQFGQDPTVLSQILQRVIIWQELDEHVLATRFSELLNHSFYVPQSMTLAVRTELVNCVRTARDNGLELISEIQKVLDRYQATHLVVPQGYVAPPNLDGLRQTLQSQYALFLTGTSNCGKTSVARVLAGELQRQGYRCELFDDVEAAGRFLRLLSTEDRVCILDDPLGSLVLRGDAAEMMEKLRHLVRDVSTHRMLIVTSRTELLRALCGDPWQLLSRMGTHSWQDLTSDSVEFICSVWHSLAAEHNVDMSVRSLVETGLRGQANDELLQPGQLRQLAMQAADDLQGRSFGELCSVAREDSLALGVRWRQRDLVFRQVVVAVAASTTTIHSIEDQDLSFLLGDSDERPGLVGDELEIYSYAGSLDRLRDRKFPSYTGAHRIGPEVRACLDELEGYGYIERRAGSVQFSHPSYLEAGYSLLQATTQETFELYSSTIGRALACLNGKAAVSAVRSLRLLLNSSAEHRAELLDMGITALRSIFPAVRDALMPLLLENLEHLDARGQERVMDEARKEHIEDFVFWHDGLPWLDFSVPGSLLGNRLSPTAQNAAIALTNDPAVGTVTSELAWQAASDIDRFPESIDRVRLLNQLLSFDEAFIRKHAAYWVGRTFNCNDVGLLERALSDEHPQVPFRCIVGLLTTWKSLDPHCKTDLIARLNRLMTSRSVAAAASGLMTQFYRHDYVHWEELATKEVGELWRLWGALFPSFLDAFPDDIIDIIQPRLWETIRQGTEYTSIETNVRIAKAWLAWIDRQLLRSLPDDYGLGIAVYIFTAIPEPDQRQFALEHILSHGDTALAFTAVAECVDLWDELIDKEKGRVIRFLTEQRSDSRWLKAVALTRTSVPEEVVRIVTGDPRMLRKPSTELLLDLPGELLEDCLHVYCGRPQPLWWLGKHHSRSNTWIELLVTISEMPDHPCFDLAIIEMLSHVLNSGAESPWDHALDIWRSLCNASNPPIRSRLLDLLTEQSMASVGCAAEPYWEALFAAASDDHERKAIVSAVVEYIEGFECYSGPRGIDDYFGNADFLSTVLEELPYDRALINLLYISQNLSSDSDMTMQVLETMRAFYDSHPPRLRHVHEAIDRWLADSQLDGSSVLRQNVERARLRSLELGRKHSEFLRNRLASREGSIVGWHFSYV